MPLSLSLSDLAALKPLRRYGPAVLVGLLVLTVFILLAAWQPSWVGREASLGMSTMGAPGAAVIAVGPGGADALADARQDALAADPPRGRSEALQRRVSLAAVALAVVWAMLGLTALALALTQRHRPDLVFAVSAAAWSIHTLMAIRSAPGMAGPPVSLPLQQLMMLLAVGSLIWYSVRLLGWRLHEPPRRAVWPAWVAGVVMACIISWSRGVDESTGPWIVPLTCLVTGLLVLSRGVTEREGPDRPPRGVGFWWVAVLGAVAIGCGAYEIWLRIALPQLIETRATLWFLTRWVVVILMAGMLVRRLRQVASSSRQLGRSHRHWRRRLRSAQAEVQDLQRGLGLRDLAEQQRLQRDQTARETLDELGVDLTRQLQRAEGAATPAVSGYLVEEALEALGWVRDSLDLAPRPLDEALETLRARLARRVGAAGGRLEWRVDAATRGVVLTAGDTLLWQRLADEAVATAISLGWAREPVSLQVDVHEGETGRHLHLALAPSGPVGAHAAPAAGPAGLDKDLFGAPREPAVAHCRGRLQRLATALGAQLVLEARPDEPTGLEVVKPLRAR